MNIYWKIVIVVIVLGIIMPQEGFYRKYYIILMTLMHSFVCAFRYKFLVGDLIRYNTEFQNLRKSGYFSKETIHEWTNTGFYWLMKFVAEVTNGNFQVFLIILAVFSSVVFSILIYRYSPRPWLSYLVWNCMAFYLTYDFCAIKQGLAMAILMLALICIFEEKPIAFLCLTLLAGFVHMPALSFLPAYFIANRKVGSRLIVSYIVVATVIFMYRTRIVDVISEFYYDESFELMTEGLGNRVLVIVLILIVGVVLKGFREKRFAQLFNIIVIAAIFQMFSGFDNVFTRLADYYLQFTVLFIPMIFYNTRNAKIDKNASPAILTFTEKSMKIFVLVLVLALIWWYQTTCLGHTIANEVDNYLNFRFMWQVQ